MAHEEAEVPWWKYDGPQGKIVGRKLRGKISDRIRRGDVGGASHIVERPDMEQVNMSHIPHEGHRVGGRHRKRK